MAARRGAPQTLPSQGLGSWGRQGGGKDPEGTASPGRLTLPPLPS